MRYVVGYTDTPSGRDALALAVQLARESNSPIELVLVLLTPSRPSLTPQYSSYNEHLRQTAETWLAAAAETVPDTIPVGTHIFYANSQSEGILEASRELKGTMIIVGASRGGMLGRLSVGSVAGSLLHSAVVPVALAPEGTRNDPPADVTRITAAVGTRAGAGQLVDAAIVFARAAHCPLRLVSLVEVDYPSDSVHEQRQLDGAAHAEEVLSYVASHLPSDISSSAEVGQGVRIEEAVRDLSWLPGELVVVGSSRLAARGRLFLGSTAARMLRELPVPLVVVPRDSVITVDDEI